MISHFPACLSFLFHDPAGMIFLLEHIRTLSIPSRLRYCVSCPRCQDTNTKGKKKSVQKNMLSVNLKSEMSSMLACSMLLQLMLFYILRTRSCVQVLRLDSEDAMTLVNRHPSRRDHAEERVLVLPLEKWAGSTLHNQS